MFTHQSIGTRGPQALRAQPARILLTRLCQMLTLPMTWHERSRHRLHLLTIDERLLRDVGLSRRDIELEASKPFWQR